MSALRPPTPLLTPSYHGHVPSAKEALILIEACLSGQFSHASRPPLSSDQDEVASSGNVFVYEEFSSGIREWNDGREWGPPSHVGGLEVAPLRPLPTQINGISPASMYKSTTKIDYQEYTHHLVAYFSISDVLGGTLLKPSSDPALAHVEIRRALNVQRTISEADERALEIYLQGVAIHPSP